MAKIRTVLPRARRQPLRMRQSGTGLRRLASCLAASALGFALVGYVANLIVLEELLAKPLPQFVTRADLSSCNKIISKAAQEPINRDAVVSILGYHDFTDSAPTPMKMNATKFREQMQELKDRDIPVVSMTDLIAWRRGEKSLQSSVVITADDGWRAFHTHALPILKEYGYPFTMYLYSDFVNVIKNKRSILDGQVRDLLAAGGEIGSHTSSHPDLVASKKRFTTNEEAYDEWLLYELKTSKEFLETRFGVRITSCSYPYGAVNDRIVKLAQEIGYEACVTVEPEKTSYQSPMLALRRYIIFGDDDTNWKKATTFEPSKIEQLTAKLSEKEAELVESQATTQRLTIELSMRERVATYTDYCSTQPNSSSMVEIPNVLITSKSDKLAGCLPQRTGSTSWFIYFYYRNFPDPQHPFPEGSLWEFMVNLDKRVSKTDITAMTSRHPDRSSYYETFVTVRHPLTRLYSGWNEHMRWVNREDKIGEQWKYFNLTENDADWATNHTCSWPRFVDLFASGKYRIDAHHWPLSRICGHCHFNWNYIVKQETLDQDSQFLVHKFFGGNATVDWNKGIRRRDPLRALTNYCQFSDETIASIEDYYDAEYLMYGYEKFNRSLLCEQNPEATL